MMKLRQLCSTNAIKDIKKYIKEYDIIPDEVCMEKICSYKKNNIIGYNTLKKYIGPNLKCIRKCAENFQANKMLLRIIDDYISIHNNKIFELENKINELENKIKKLENNNLHV